MVGMIYTVNCLQNICERNKMARQVGECLSHITRKNRTMNLTYVYILWAKRTDIEHEFMEVFTSIDQLEGFLFNHPEIIKCEISLHEVNPD